MRLLPALALSLVVTLWGVVPVAAQQHKSAVKAPAKVVKAAPAPQPVEPVVAESLSGLDLLPNRRTGTFGIRINHRISQPATLRLLDVKTSRYLKTELLEPSAAPTRAVQVGRLPMGEYKMEVVLPDTIYWKTVRVSK